MLATAATALAHGQQAAAAAAETARATFEGAGGVVDLPRVSIDLLAEPAPVPALRLFVVAGLATSNAEARRLIRGGGARLNDVVINDEQMTLSHSQLRDGVKVSAGRKQHRMVVGA